MEKRKPGRKKRTRELIPIGFSFSLSKEKLEFINSVKNKMGVSRSQIFNFGVEKLLELIQEIESNIFLGNYVVGYFRENKSGNSMRGEQFSREGSIKMYIYDIHKSSRRGYYCFCKENNDNTDMNFKTIYIGPHFISRSLIDEFPQTYKDIFPE